MAWLAALGGAGGAGAAGAGAAGAAGAGAGAGAASALGAGAGAGAASSALGPALGGAAVNSALGSGVGSTIGSSLGQSFGGFTDAFQTIGQGLGVGEANNFNLGKVAGGALDLRQASLDFREDGGLLGVGANLTGNLLNKPSKPQGGPIQDADPNQFNSGGIASNNFNSLMNNAIGAARRRAGIQNRTNRIIS
jgi:hypothetical protein